MGSSSAGSAVGYADPNVSPSLTAVGRKTPPSSLERSNGTTGIRSISSASQFLSQSASVNGLPNQDRSGATSPSHNRASTVELSEYNRLKEAHKRLRGRVAALEKENEALKASVYELSIRYGSLLAKPKPLVLGSASGTDDRTDPKPLKWGEQTRAATPVSSSLTQSLAATSLASSVASDDVLGQSATRLALSDTQATRVPHSDAETTPTMASDHSTLGGSSSLSSTQSSSPSGGILSSDENSASSTAAALLPSLPKDTRLPRSPIPAQKLQDWSTFAGVQDTEGAKEVMRYREKEQERAKEEQANKHKGGYQWGFGYNLSAHKGAIYALQFSPDARLLASAGFDGIRIWAPDLAVNPAQADATSKQTETAQRQSRASDQDTLAFDAEVEDDSLELVSPWDRGQVGEIAHCRYHTAPVSDLCFSPSSERLVSSGYDSTVQCIDTHRGVAFIRRRTATSDSDLADTATLTSTSYAHATTGLAQCVAWARNPDLINNVFFFGTSRKTLSVVDIRTPDQLAATITNDAMVNSIQACIKSSHLLIGDGNGAIKTIDLRTNQFIDPFNSPTTTPRAKEAVISHLSFSPGMHNSEPRWMAVTSFDNIIKAYDRGSDHTKLRYRQTFTLKGKNRTWPIRAAWFQGADYTDMLPSTRRSSISQPLPPQLIDSPGRSRPAGYGGSDRAEEDTLSSPPAHSKRNQAESSVARSGTLPLSSSLLLAAGSSDPKVLLFDLSHPPGSSSASPQLIPALSPVQVLEGHTEAVYTVSFLRQRGEYSGEGLLASGGGDGVVKVWTPHAREDEEV
ncbi:uncharacterized protein L969DRAFT_25200 [Mixia osmundae IAM 14324]|uniref:Uncharacterized protein n=1 Tax=Mixia osmundae (strain CBS 9802 / IAM 14324 / JCM 22182 / KY 12970) TaxID=764103 RepID=G7DSH9_MIXOS|nr:uncharacterized protein L969DRAFT_25200 [Mixia osmundae IAM 14324]KEI37963.1 hypothetical protein L969DRAFT_25200 [Mixia osmundae IAM 14324]GAA93539.1 hypothetical protein E5Q_00183 [Mixia osmundae IAM 14324]